MDEGEIDVVGFLAEYAFYKFLVSVFNHQISKLVA